MKLSRLKPWPKDRAERWLVLVLVLALTACGLTACSDSWTLATKADAEQVARDNAEAAKTNPISAVIHGLATLAASLAGAGLLVKRWFAKEDAKEFTPEDAASMDRARKIDTALKG